tara:strand:- start:16656 stop:16817 length:162 start_codon:yes stop_codon:yes gene_type:complete
MTKHRIPSKAIRKELEEIYENNRDNYNYGKLEHPKVKLTFWQKLIGIFKDRRK